MEEKSFRIYQVGDVEIFAIPHQKEYAVYRDWRVPPKRTKLRIAVAHALVAGAGFTIDDVEEEASVMDHDLFARFGVDYAALGHIHAGRKDPARCASSRPMAAGSRFLHRRLADRGALPSFTGP